MNRTEQPTVRSALYIYTQFNPKSPKGNTDSLEFHQVFKKMYLSASIEDDSPLEAQLTYLFEVN